MPSIRENHVEKARRLLSKGESELPDAVSGTIAFLSSRDIWFRLDRNPICKSCLEAAPVRRRLGKTGIPIWDEFKSAVFDYTTADGKSDRVAVHCRGDRRLKEKAIATFLNARGELSRVPMEVLQADYAMNYGIVHPFSERLSSTSVHIFDEDLVTPIGVPGTSMTNAGDMSWAVEFRAKELLDCLPRKAVARISELDPRASRRLWGVRARRQIGIVTGNAPESGMLLWELINENVRQILGDACSGDVSMPPVSAYSIPEMGLSMELSLREEETWAAVQGAVERACVGGARIIALACNTTQYFAIQIRQLCDEWGATFVSIPDSVYSLLRAEGVTRVRLAGIGYVTHLEKWSAFANMEGVEVLPLAESDVSLIEEIAFKVKQGQDRDSNVHNLRAILSKPDEGKAKSKKPLPLLLALTELSVILRESKVWQDRLSSETNFGDRRIIDTLGVYAQAIAAEYLGIGFPLNSA